MRLQSLNDSLSELSILNGGAVYNPSVAIADIQGERFFVTASGWPTRGGSMVITRLIRN